MGFVALWLGYTAAKLIWTILAFILRFCLRSDQLTICIELCNMLTTLLATNKFTG